MARDSFYPDIQAGDDVLFATNPHAQDCQFRPGKVRIAKLESCDIVVFGDNGRGEFRHDCLHVDDPRCQEAKIWNEPGRGVFKLSAHEIERRQDHAAVQQMLVRMDQLDRHLEGIVLNQPGQPKRSGRLTRFQDTDPTAAG